MRVIFVTGSDTGIGKTRVTAAIGRLLGRPGLRIQFIKPVETGRAPGEPGDADDALHRSGVAGATAFTLIRFPLPLAPVAAAEAAGAPPLSIEGMLEKWRALPPAELRIVEGAGGIAVPLDADGHDWTDFARAIAADRVVLVIPDRLGAINQGRLAAAYAAQHRLPAGLWLNETEPQSAEIRDSNRRGLATLPVWARQRFDAPLPEDPDGARSRF